MLYTTDKRDEFAAGFNRSLIRGAWGDARERGTDLYADLVCFPDDEYAWSFPSGVDGDHHIPWDNCDIIILWFDGARSFPDRRAYFVFGRTLGELPREKCIFATPDFDALLLAFPDLEELRQYQILNSIATPQDAANLLARKNVPPPDYGAYLASAHWKEARAAALEAAGHRCQLCNAGSRLQAHHRTYERIGHELPGDLIVLCGTCHGVFHGRLRRDGQ